MFKPAENYFTFSFEFFQRKLDNSSTHTWKVALMNIAFIFLYLPGYLNHILPNPERLSFCFQFSVSMYMYYLSSLPFLFIAQNENNKILLDYFCDNKYNLLDSLSLFFYICNSEWVLILYETLYIISSYCRSFDIPMQSTNLKCEDG